MMNFFYLAIGIILGIAGLAILVWLMIPPKSLRDKAGYSQENRYNDSQYPHNNNRSSL